MVFETGYIQPQELNGYGVASLTLKDLTGPFDTKVTT